MRTYQDAKIMAKSLRGCLDARNVSLSLSEFLEIVAQQLGYADWNILAAKPITRPAALEGIFKSWAAIMPLSAKELASLSNIVSTA